MCPRRFELPYAFDPLNRDGEPCPDEGLSKSLETVENYVAVLRIQIFLEKVVRDFFEAPVRAVAPGQAAAIYQEERCLGGAPIVRAL